MRQDQFAAFPAFQEQWQQLQVQWHASAVLRRGIWACCAILLTWILLVALDHVEARRGELQSLVSEHQRLRAIPSAQAWSKRAADAGQQVAALSSMAWAEPDLGLSEAAVQDALRNLTARLGLVVRELRVGRVEPLAAAAVTSTTLAPLPTPAGHVELRVKLVVDLQRGPLMVLLAELARSERSLVVDRLVWRGSAQPPQAELELRALAVGSPPAAKERK